MPSSHPHKSNGLTPVKSPHIINDISSSVPALVAEDIANENHLGEFDPLNPKKQNGTTTTTSYGTIDGDLENEGVVASSSSEEEPDEGFALPARDFYPVMLSCFSLVFLNSLDGTILSTLLTTIASDLNAVPLISWIATSYLLSCSIFQPLFGKLSDIFGRKPLLILCIVIFTIGLVLCAIADNIWFFVFARGLTGFAGGLNTLTTIIMSDLVPLRKRGVYQGMGNAFYALGSATGGSLGGWIAKSYGWRWSFWFQVPIAILCLISVLINLNLPKNVHHAHHSESTMKEKVSRIDFLGSSLLVGGLLFFMLALSIGGNQVEYSSIQFQGLIIGCFIFFSIFVYVEKNMALEPVVPVSLLTNRSVLASSLANWFGTMFIYAANYYFPVYLTTVMQMNSAQIGLRLIPTIFAASASSFGSGLYMRYTGKYLKYSIVMNSIGSFGCILLVIMTYNQAVLSLISQYFLLTMPYIAYSAMLTVTLLALIAAVPVHQQASSTSIQYAFRSTGSTLGMTIASAVFTVSLKKQLNFRIPKTAPEGVSKEEITKVITKALHNADYLRVSAPEWARDTLVDSYGHSCWLVFVFAFMISILCLISICCIKEYKLHTTVNRK